MLDPLVYDIPLTMFFKNVYGTELAFVFVTQSLTGVD